MNVYDTDEVLKTSDEKLRGQRKPVFITQSPVMLDIFVFSNSVSGAKKMLFEDIERSNNPVRLYVTTKNVNEFMAQNQANLYICYRFSRFNSLFSLSSLK